MTTSRRGLAPHSGRVRSEELTNGDLPKIYRRWVAVGELAALKEAASFSAATPPGLRAPGEEPRTDRLPKRQGDRTGG
jgi:hypothetical protein